jgi:hypothetical protein
LSVVLKNSDLSAPLLNFHVSAFTAETGTFTVSPDPVAAGLASEDILTIRAMPPGSCSSTTIGDAKFVNGQIPGGMKVDQEIGNLVRIITGTGRGQVRRISDNTTTLLTIDTPWTVNPDATSRFIIESPSWEFISESNPTINSDRSLITSVSVPVSNALDYDFLVQSVAVDSFSVESPDELSPIRSIHVNAATGNPSSASTLEVLTHVDDVNIPTGQMCFQFIPDNENGSEIWGVQVILSPESVAQGPYAAERSYHPETILESGTCEVVRDSRDIVVTRSSSSGVVNKVFVIWTDDAYPDSDLNGSMIESQNTNSLQITDALPVPGVYNYAILEPWWPPNDTTNAFAYWFPRRQITQSFWGKGSKWRTPPITLPEGAYGVTVYSRNKYGLGTRLTAGPITVAYNQTVTTDTGNPSGCSGLSIITTVEDATIPEGCMAFRFSRDTYNYKSIVAAEIALSVTSPGHGPYAAQRSAHAADVLASGTGLSIVGGKKIIDLTISSPAPPNLNGKVLLIFKTGDEALTGDFITLHGASTIEVATGFARTDTYNWAVVEWWGPLNAWEQTFWVPDDFKISDLDQATWQTKPVPLISGTFYGVAYTHNLFGVSVPV